MHPTAHVKDKDERPAKYWRMVRRMEGMLKCVSCMREKHDTVCGLCLSCTEAIISRRHNRSAYQRQEKRNKAYEQIYLGYS